jgi:predicted nucleic acid-binding protein
MQPFPSATVLHWLSRASESGPLYVTAITMAEILYGIELLPRGKRRDKMQVEAQAMFAEDFGGHILPFDEEAARAFAQIAAARRARGRPIAEPDAQIAAIARSRNATLATRNTADFENCGIRLTDPWQSP